MRWTNFLLFGDRRPVTRPAGASDPEQTYQIALADQIVPYTIHRRQRRRLSLHIDHRGLRVLGPMRTSAAEVAQLIRHHEDWVLRKLDEWQSTHAQRQWTIDSQLPLSYLGTPLSVVLRAHTLKTPKVALETTQLIVCTSDPRDHTRHHRALVLWLREQAMHCFAERVALYAGQLGVDMPKLALSQARTRWGSCNHRGDIRLNWRLIHLPVPLIDYVVAHELAHLKEMNHSPRFWAVVETLVPTWRAARLALRQHITRLPEIPIR